MTATVTSIRLRTEEIHVKRVALARASENALAASRSAQDAADRAAQHLWSGNRAGVLHALGRIGFELEARTAALMALTHVAETATACPDGIAAPNHGEAA
jgi:hypothetical protein